MLSVALGAGALALVVFHVWLFWGQWQVGRLTDPFVAVRWAGSALLVLALLALRRRHVPVLRGRQALVIWTLAAIVHVGADTAAVTASPEFSSGLLFVVPSVAGAALVAACALLAAALRQRRSHRRSPVARVRTLRARCRPSLFLTCPRALRAPPLVA